MDQLKDKELQRTYEELFETFSSPGWMRLAKQAEALRKQLDTVRGVKDLFELGVRTGEVKNLDWLLGFPQACEYSYAELQRNDGQDVDAPATPGKAEILS